jgi:hypothetical protein
MTFGHPDNELSGPPRMQRDGYLISRQAGGSGEEEW